MTMPVLEEAEFAPYKGFQDAIEDGAAWRRRPRLTSVTLGMGGKISLPGYSSIEPTASLTWEVTETPTDEEYASMKAEVVALYRSVLARDLHLAKAVAAGPEAYVQALAEAFD